MTTGPVSGAAPEQSDAVYVLDALAASHGAFLLYPDPTGQPIFVRAVETLSSIPHFPWQVEVGAGEFVFAGETVTTVRDGAVRLAEKLFVHDVGYLEIVGPPSPADLCSFFETLDVVEEEVKAGGGLGQVLQNRAVTTIRLLGRGALIEARHEPERDHRVVSLLEAAEQPELLTEDLLERFGTEPRPFAEGFHTYYLSLDEKVKSDDVIIREELVRSFVESFFFLDRSLQVATLDRFLESKDEIESQVFLDQFAGHDLADLSPQLSGVAQDRLMEYARLASDKVGGRPEELINLLQSAAEVKEAQHAVARHVQALLKDEFSDSAADGYEWQRNLRQQLAEMDRAETTGIRVLRTILEVESRPPRFARILRVWTARIVDAIRRDDFDEAERWASAVLDDPPHPDDRADMVAAAFEKIADGTTLPLVVAALGRDAAAGPSQALLQRWGTTVTDKLVETLATEEDPGHRRSLIDVLADLARRDPDPLVRYLTDDRWYVVRNLAVVLGRSGRRETAGHLRRLLGHSDHRVRIDALRALVPLIGPASLEAMVSAMRDDHPRVRQTALTLLRASTDERVDSVLADELDRTTDPVDIRRIVETMADRHSDEALDRLARYAGRKVALTPTSRALREAAKQALRRGAA